jgi:hypothetical protein
MLKAPLKTLLPHLLRQPRLPHRLGLPVPCLVENPPDCGSRDIGAFQAELPSKVSAGLLAAISVSLYLPNNPLFYLSSLFRRAARPGSVLKPLILNEEWPEIRVKSTVTGPGVNTVDSTDRETSLGRDFKRGEATDRGF